MEMLLRGCPQRMFDHGALMTNGSYPVIDESSCGPLRGIIRALKRLLKPW